jgi:hypothetical protein
LGAETLKGRLRAASPPRRSRPSRRRACRPASRPLQPLVPEGLSWEARLRMMYEAAVGMRCVGLCARCGEKTKERGM